MLQNGVRLTVGCIALAVVFGILHDLVTAHVSLPYFTVHHPKLITSQSPIVQALFWGVLATWWMGLAAGIMLSVANGLRKLPMNPAVILRKVAIGLLVVLAISLSVLVIVYGIASQMPETQRRPTFEADRRLVAVAVAHQLSYALAAVFAVGLTVWVALHKGREQEP